MAERINLWPIEFGEIKIRTPYSIMTEQAQALGRRTENIVMAAVKSGGMVSQTTFVYIFNIYCTSIGHQVELFRFTHEIALYPVTIYAHNSTKQYNPSNPDELYEALKEIFSFPSTMQLIASMIAQASD